MAMVHDNLFENNSNNVSILNIAFSNTTSYEKKSRVETFIVNYSLDQCIYITR